MTQPPEKPVPDADVPEDDAHAPEKLPTLVPASEVPASEVPESEVPESEVPESELPESELPESELPESELPGTAAPVSDVPVLDRPDEQEPVNAEVPAAVVEPDPEATSTAKPEPTPTPTEDSEATSTEDTEPTPTEDSEPTPTEDSDTAGTEGPAGRTRPHRHRRRFGRGPLLAALLLGVLGFSLVVQVRQTSVVGIASLNQSELVQILGTVTGQSQKVEQETQELLRAQAELRSGTDSAAAAEKNARERIKVLAILAGTVPAAGPGIELTMTDKDNPVNAAAVLNAVQELRDAGAEAMQISAPGGSVRIVANTYFTDDVGGSARGILVSGTRLRSPYTITAIGEGATMESALQIPGGVLDALRQSGADGSVSSPRPVTVMAVIDQTQTSYASPGPG